MNRRTFLATSLVGIATVSAGCSDLLSDKENEGENYESSLYNESQETHSFRVRVGDSLDGGWFYDETFELDSETGDENIPIDDTPVTIALTVDASIEREFSWPASSSEPGTAAHVAELWYDPARDQEIYLRG